MTHPRSAFGAPPQGGAATGPAEPDPRRLLGSDVLLSVCDLGVRFGGVLAVNKVGFDVKRGEVFPAQWDPKLGIHVT